LILCVVRFYSGGRYQNGAFWATPLHYLARAALVVAADDTDRNDVDVVVVDFVDDDAAAARDTESDNARNPKGPSSPFVAAATEIVTEALDYFRGRRSPSPAPSPSPKWQGINECVNPRIGYHGVDAYVASGTNALQALADLLAAGATERRNPGVTE
jgi:hypothetical protein